MIVTVLYYSVCGYIMYVYLVPEDTHEQIESAASGIMRYVRSKWCDGFAYLDVVSKVRFVVSVNHTLEGV